MKSLQRGLAENKEKERNGLLEYYFRQLDSEKGSLLSEMWVLFGWVEEAPFIAAGSHLFPRNHLIWPSFFLPSLSNLTKSGIFGSSMLFLAAASISSHLLLFFYSLFHGQV
ncbi:unnamed protein product [Prunus armeniaca]